MHHSLQGDVFYSVRISTWPIIVRLQSANVFLLEFVQLVSLKMHMWQFLGVNVFSQEIHKYPIIYSYCQNSICCFIDSKNDLYMYDMVRKYKIHMTNTTSLIEKYGKISGIVQFYDDLIVYFHSHSIVRLNSSDNFKDELLKRNIRVFCTFVDTFNGILWIGTDGQGVISIARKTGIVNNIMLKQISHNLSGQIRGILTDSIGNLWIGTKGDGILCIPDYINGLNID